MIRTPLKRKTRLRPRREEPRKKAGKLRERPKRARRLKDAAYLAHVRRQPCLVPGCPARPTEAHHFGLRGLGQKCPDSESAPLCGNHHRAWWHDRGHLPGMTSAESKQLIHRVGSELRAEWERR